MLMIMTDKIAFNFVRIVGYEEVINKIWLFKHKSAMNQSLAK